VTAGTDDPSLLVTLVTWPMASEAYVVLMSPPKICAVTKPSVANSNTVSTPSPSTVLRTWPFTLPILGKLPGRLDRLRHTVSVTGVDEVETAPFSESWRRIPVMLRVMVRGTMPWPTESVRASQSM